MRADNANAYADRACVTYTHTNPFSYAYCDDTTIADAYALDTGIAYAYADSYAQGDTKASADSASSAVREAVISEK